MGQRSTLNFSYLQARTAALGMAAALLLFVLTQRLCVPRFDLSSQADGRIPFVPASWYVYVLFYPYVIGAATVASPARFGVFKIAALLAFGTALCCFLAVPELVARPDVTTIDGAFLRQRFARMWRIDQPTHGFPSLHVALTLLAAWMVLDRRRGWMFATLGVIICVSTLTVKQHTCVDVMGGVLLSLGSVAIAKRLTSRRVR